MHARVTQLHVKAEKAQEFLDGLDSLMPELRKQVGFRSFVAMRTESSPGPEITTISVWDSFADLKGSEKNLFYYKALSRLMGFSEGFTTREYEVVLAEFAAD